MFIFLNKSKFVVKLNKFYKFVFIFASMLQLHVHTQKLYNCMKTQLAYSEKLTAHSLTCQNFFLLVQKIILE